MNGTKNGLKNLPMLSFAISQLKKAELKFISKKRKKAKANEPMAEIVIPVVSSLKNPKCRE